MKIRCLIIDDEQLARDMLEEYAKKLQFLEVVSKCHNGKSAQMYLEKNEVDLIFLDIQMPGNSGIDFLRTLPSPPKAIFTTAFSNHAVEGFELGAIDYLLKPIGFNRFSEAIIKVKSQIETERKAIAFDAVKKFENQTITIKEGYHFRKIKLKDIIYIEAMREYIAYFTNNEKIMELKAISKIEKILPKSHFIRVHRSFIISTNAILKKESNRILLKNNITIPIGKTFKKELRILLENMVNI